MQLEENGTQCRTLKNTLVTTFDIAILHTYCLCTLPDTACIIFIIYNQNDNPVCGLAQNISII